MKHLSIETVISELTDKYKNTSDKSVENLYENTLEYLVKYLTICKHEEALKDKETDDKIANLQGVVDNWLDGFKHLGWNVNAKTTTDTKTYYRNAIDTAIDDWRWRMNKDSNFVSTTQEFLSLLTQKDINTYINDVLEYVLPTTPLQMKSLTVTIKDDKIFDDFHIDVCKTSLKIYQMGNTMKIYPLKAYINYDEQNGLWKGIIKGGYYSTAMPIKFNRENIVNLELKDYTDDDKCNYEVTDTDVLNDKENIEREEEDYGNV